MADCFVIRGFGKKTDYGNYNGENYADDILTAAFKDPATAERTDYRWMLATMANVLYALGKDIEAAEYEAKCRSLRGAEREIDTFEGGKERAQKITAAAACLARRRQIRLGEKRDRVLDQASLEGHAAGHRDRRVPRMG